MKTSVSGVFMRLLFGSGYYFETITDVSLKQGLNRIALNWNRT